MALSDILQAIDQEGSNAVEEIRKKGEKQKQELQTEFDKEIAKKKQELLARIEYRADKKVSQATWELTSRLNTAVLKRKQGIIDGVFSAALQEMANLSNDQAISLLTRLFKQLPELENAEIIPAKEKIEVVKKAMKDAGMNLSIADKKIDAIGGFVVETKEMNIDMTFETLLKAYRADHETDVASKLF